MSGINKARGLGRGLAALIPGAAVVEDVAVAMATGRAPLTDVVTIENGPRLLHIGIEKIRPNRYQPRTEFADDKLQELSDSIKEHGLAEPILVSPSQEAGMFDLIAGERRWRAAGMAGLEKIPAVVRQVTDRARLEISLIENLQREDLNAIESGMGYRRLMDDFGLTQEQVSQAVGKSRPAVANILRLLELPEYIQDAIRAGRITEGHGRAAASVQDPQKQRELVDRIIREKLTVREAEALASASSGRAAKALRPRKAGSAELAQLEHEFQKIVGTRVKIRGSIRSGKVVLYYYSLQDLERLAAQFRRAKVA